MTPEIQIKLGRFLSERLPFTEECQIVYLLVEIRKILDQENNGKYPLLRFYADWSVHTAKDKINREIKTIMEKILADIKASQTGAGTLNPRSRPLSALSFMSTVEMKKEMKSFLQEYGLPCDLVSLENWNSVQLILPNILADQPINSPCAGMRVFAFKPVENGRVVAEIEYEKTPAVYDTIEIGGAF